ncbi:MAG: proton-conducting transporter transmembrane domain-containing protein [Syntrophales bacterium]
MTDPEIYRSLLPLYAVLVSLAAALLIALSSRHIFIREFWTLAASVAKFSFVLLLLPGVLAGKVAEFTFWEISPGISLALKADSFGVFFALIASGLWMLTSIYSIGYVRGLNEHKQTRYFASFAICLSATIGVAFAANLLTFIFFYEILTIATYPLVIHKETSVAIAAGRKYLVYTLTAGVLLIAATAWTYRLAGTLDFKAGGMFGDALLSPGTVLVLFALFIGGVGVKAAIMPLHSWLPAAMVAPTPVSALLHAVAVVKSGVFGVVRVVGFVFGPQLMRQFDLNIILATFAGVTIILASLLAFRQDNLKHRLAYSTVGHLSYIVLGAALLSPASLVGSLLHIASHATMKITLFFCAGAIYVTHHKEKISELDGIGRVMPWTMGAFTIGAIGLAGVPPLNGFVSKWQLGLGSLQSGSVVPLALLLLSGILNAGYFAPVVYRAFFKSPSAPFSKGEASPAMVIPLAVTAFLSILWGIRPDLFLHFYSLAAQVSGSILGVTGS